MSEKRLALKFSFFLSALLLCSCDEQAASKQESTPTTKTKSEVQKDPEAAENDASPVPDADSAKQVKAQRLIAQSVAAKLIQACESFYDDYSFLPSNEDREVDSELTTTGGEKSDLMAVLVGLESHAESRTQTPSHLHLASSPQPGPRKRHRPARSHFAAAPSFRQTTAHAHRTIHSRSPRAPQTSTQLAGTILRPTRRTVIPPCSPAFTSRPFR